MTDPLNNRILKPKYSRIYSYIGVFVKWKRYDVKYLTKAHKIVFIKIKYLVQGSLEYRYHTMYYMHIWSIDLVYTVDPLLPHLL